MSASRGKGELARREGKNGAVVTLTGVCVFLSGLKCHSSNKTELEMERSSQHMMMEMSSVWRVGSERGPAYSNSSVGY